MKKTPKQWLADIETTQQNKSNDSWIIAYCPICGVTEQADVRGSSSMAEIAAKGKVMSHIGRNHLEYVDDTIPVV